MPTSHRYLIHICLAAHMHGSDPDVDMRYMSDFMTDEIQIVMSSCNQVYMSSGTLIFFSCLLCHAACANCKDHAGDFI